MAVFNIRPKVAWETAGRTSEEDERHVSSYGSKLLPAATVPQDWKPRGPLVHIWKPCTPGRRRDQAHSAGSAPFGAPRKLLRAAGLPAWKDRQ